MSALAPIDSKLSPALPPPERTTSAGPAGGSGAGIQIIGPEAQRRFADALAHQERPAAGAIRSRLGALKAALRAVDMTHWPPPRIDPRSPASTCSPALDRFARSAVMMSICACITRRLREMSSSSVSRRRISAQRASSSIAPRSGSGSSSPSAGSSPVPSRSVDRTTRGNASRNFPRQPAPSTCWCARPGGCRCAREAGDGDERRRLPHPRVGRATSPTRHRRAAAGRGAFPRAPFRSGIRVCEKQRSVGVDLNLRLSCPADDFALRARLPARRSQDCGPAAPVAQRTSARRALRTYWAAAMTASTRLIQKQTIGHVVPLLVTSTNPIDA